MQTLNTNPPREDQPMHPQKKDPSVFSKTLTASKLNSAQRNPSIKKRQKQALTTDQNLDLLKDQTKPACSERKSRIGRI